MLYLQTFIVFASDAAQVTKPLQSSTYNTVEMAEVIFGIGEMENGRFVCLSTTIVFAYFSPQFEIIF